MTKETAVVTGATGGVGSAYAEGLAHWRGREFDAAARCFERAADFDKPSALFLERVRAFEQHPPDKDWEAVTTLEAK